MGREELADQFLRCIPRAMWTIRKKMRKNVGEELTIPHFRVLAHLQSGAHSNTQLAEIQGVSVAAMSRMVQTLVSRGYVARKSHPEDRREVRVSLTSKGSSHFEKIRKQTCNELVPLMDQLDSADQLALRRGLDLIEKFLGTELKEESED